MISSPGDSWDDLARDDILRYPLLEASSLKKVSSSIGRVAVSKTVGWGFESLLACHLLRCQVDSAYKIHVPIIMSRILAYWNEVVIELRKATWPWDPKEKGFAKYKELNDSTIVVFVGMILLGGFVAFFDFSFRKAFDALTAWLTGM